MKQKINRNNKIIKQKGSLWKVKVGLSSPVFIEDGNLKIESKYWKIKVILN